MAHHPVPTDGEQRGDTPARSPRQWLQHRLEVLRGRPVRSTVPAERLIYLIVALLVVLTVGALVLATLAWRWSRPPSPGETVRRAYLAANAGNYSEANEYFSAETLQILQSSMGAFVGGTKGSWDSVTRNGAITRIEIVQTQVRGEGATVTAQVYFQIGARPPSLDRDVGHNPRTDTVTLIKERGRWKIADRQWHKPGERGAASRAAVARRGPCSRLSVGDGEHTAAVLVKGGRAHG